jgi:hypothetical protein
VPWGHNAPFAGLVKPVGDGVRLAVSLVVVGIALPGVVIATVAAWFVNRL